METKQKVKSLKLGAISKLGYILPENFTFTNIFESESFEVCQPLTNNDALVYACQFQDFERAEYLYMKANQADEADKPMDWLDWMEKLQEQPIEILDVEVK